MLIKHNTGNGQTGVLTSVNVLEVTGICSPLQNASPCSINGGGQSKNYNMAKFIIEGALCKLKFVVWTKLRFHIISCKNS